MFNNAGPIVPPMKNVVGNTHAETRAEIEARARAEQAAQAAMLAAAEEKAKKSPWPAILIIIFAFIAVAAGGFAVYEYLELEKLNTKLKTTETTLNEQYTNIDELEKEITTLKTENKRLKARLNADGTSEEGSENGSENSSKETTPETKPAE